MKGELNLLRINKLSKEFNKKKVLENINMEIKQGEVIGIIGPSGSGKSTLLRCINFLEEPTEGTIEFNGKIVINDRKKIEELRTNIGMVFQEFNLFERKNVLTNIITAPILTKKMTKNEAIEEAIKLLKFVGLEDKIYSMPETLSGGQKQRVAIARALAMEPKLLLLDEPTSALDPELIQEVLKVIKMLAQEKITMLIVTHQIKFVKEIADRIIFMENGKIIEEGTPSEILENPQINRTKKFLSDIL